MTGKFDDVGIPIIIWNKGKKEWETIYMPKMTEKRFTQIDEDDWEILDRNKHFAYAHSGYQAEKIIQELNELVETNRELYKENNQLKKKLKKKEKLIEAFEQYINDLREVGVLND